MSKPTVSRIENDALRLRLLEEADLEMTLRWRNQEHIRRWFVYSAVLTAEQHQEWFQHYLRRDNDLVFIIEETQQLKKPVGQISLYDIDFKNGIAEFGRLMIGEADAQRKGFAKAASNLLVNFGFDQLQLKEIKLEVFKDNLSAFRIYEAIGFSITGEKDNLYHMRIINHKMNVEAPS
jgi:RimJ/RimL family protein N-acetyltransferase